MEGSEGLDFYSKVLLVVEDYLDARVRKWDSRRRIREHRAVDQFSAHPRREIWVLWVVACSCCR
jgi:hypothetical protein